MHEILFDNNTSSEYRENKVDLTRIYQQWP